MIIGNTLMRYKQEIWDAVLHYAYSNYHPTPLMEKIDLNQWCGEIFDVYNMEKELHSDIIDDLKALDMYDNIKKTCDKFVILPDVWSMSKIPITGPTYPRNQYDIDRANVVIINNKIFDLKDLVIKSIKYNHNRLLYCFYDSKKAGNIFDTPSGQKPQMDVIWVYENAFIIDNIKGNEDKWNIPDGDEWYKFAISEDNKIVNVADDVNRVGVAINSYWVEFDYSSSVDPRVETHCPGLASFGTDTWIRPKWWNIEDINRVFVHNKHVIFSNTFLIMYKDGSYRIDNTYSREKDVVIEKIDKHTIRMEKNDNISKIIVFVKPFDPDRYPVPDSLYYKATTKNMYSAIQLKRHKKYTNELYIKMTQQEGIDLDWIINYGYKYDLDVLKVIQNVFRTVIPINKFNDVDIRTGYGFFKPKLLIKVWNKLQMYPLLFINHKLYMADYRIIKEDDSDLLVIDPEQCFKLIDDHSIIQSKEHNIDNNTVSGRIGEYIPPQPEHDNYRDIAWIRNSFNKVVDDIKVVFVNYNYVNKDQTSRQSGRIFRSPIYKKELILDEVGSINPNSLFKGYQFVNGCLSNECFSGDLYRRLDGVNIFGYGDLDFTVTNNSSPSDTDVYQVNGETSLTHIIPPLEAEINKPAQLKLILNDTVTGQPEISEIKVIPDSVEVGYGSTLQLSIADPSSLKNKDSIYNGLNTSLLINRLNSPLQGICKVFLSDNHISYVNQYIFGDTMYPADAFGRLSEHHTVVFDKYGYECTDDVDILSSMYINCDNMYNYVGNKELFDDIVVHMFPSALKDIVREYDLTIDSGRIQKYYNYGNYNDKALEDINIRALFLPNEPSEVRPIPVNKKSNYILLGQKILTRYWLGVRGKVSDIDGYRKEVSGLNNIYVKPDGSIGTIPQEFTEFVKTDELRGDINIGYKMTSVSVVYNTLVNSGITYIDYNSNYINSDNSYEVEVNEHEDKVTDNGICTLQMSNDNFIVK